MTRALACFAGLVVILQDGQMSGTKFVQGVLVYRLFVYLVS